MLEKQIEQWERKATLRNDLKVRQQEQEREQATTFHQHAVADAETPRGRFTAVAQASVIGSKPDVASAYPAAAAAHQIQLPDEPPLSAYENPGFEPSTVNPSAPVEATSPADAPTALPSVERDAGLLSPENMVAQCMSQLSSSSARGDDVRIERPPFTRRRL